MLPKETLSEILRYLVEHEEFKSIDDLGSISRNEVRTALLELASHLQIEAKREQNLNSGSYQNYDELSPKVKHVLSTLTPREFQALLKQFGLPEGDSR